MFAKALIAAAALASSAYAHSNLFFPLPREHRSNAYVNGNDNSCESLNTFIPQENNFARGQKVPVKWWWNNHDGGFISMSILRGLPPNVDAAGRASLLANENIIQGQCYTRSCARDGFDPGNTKECNGHEMELPTWLEDGEYVLQWSHFGGYNSEAVPTRQLPIYHNCANIRIQGGAPKTDRPGDWIAPFFGGDMVQVNGQDAGPDRCAFKRFAREPADPASVNVKDDDPSTIQLGGPEGWAAVGRSNQKRNENVRLPRLGHVARNWVPSTEDGVN